MKVAVVYSSSLNASWAVSDGMVHTLRKLGHQVLDLPQSALRYGSVNWWDCVREINQSDLMIMGGPEYAGRLWSYCGFRGRCCVRNLDHALAAINVPKFGIYHESRKPWPVYGDFEFEKLRHHFNQNFYGTIQDAEEMERNCSGRCHWLPFSADTDFFYAQGLDRPIVLGFIGNTYPDRLRFLDQFYRLMPDSSYAPVIGNALVRDIEGINPVETVRRLAWSYNRIQIFVCLPSVFPGMMSKATEAMACGCCVLHPRLKGIAERNMLEFEDRNDLLFYDASPEGLCKTINVVLNESNLVKNIASNAVTRITREHSLRKRMEFVLSKMQE